MGGDDPGQPSPLVRYGVLTPIAVVLAILFVTPLVWMVTSAIRPADEILRYLNPLSIRAVVPVSPTLSSFSALADGPYPRSVMNHVIVATVTDLVGLAVCSTAAFALSVLRFRFQNLLFTVVVVSFLIPFEAIAIPLATLFRSWNLDNSYAGLILPGIGNGLAIFLLRQFFLGMPPDLREAARVDGASWWTIFVSIYLRLSGSALLAAGLILFVFQWQSYLWPLLIVSNQKYEVAPVTLAKFLGQFDFDYGQLFAGAVIITIIPVLLVLPMQRYFTQSIARTGIK